MDTGRRRHAAHGMLAASDLGGGGVRRVLAPSLARIRRAPGTVQLGLDPSRALLLTGLDPDVEPLLDPGLHHDLAAALAARGGEAGEHTRLLALLDDAGALVDPQSLLPPPGADPLDDARRAPDRASAALLTGATGAGGRDVLERRARRWVEVRGAGRVGGAVAELLAAAGVGHVLVDDPGPVRPGDLPPGRPLDDVGARRGRAAERAAGRSALGVRHDPPPGAAHPDLVVLAPVRGLARTAALRLTATGRPHLLALVVDCTGVVGPLVLPGDSSCLRCQDLHRTDRDPGWPQVLAQAGDARGVAACDTTLAALVAASAAQQALAHLDGWQPSTVDATLETTLPSGTTRRRRWQPHPACGCRWDADV